MPNIAEPSVKSLLLQMQFQGHPLATGTGFVANSVRGPVLITNLHNVTGRHPQTGQPLSPTGGVPDEITILHNRANHLGEWVPKTEPLLNVDGPRWIEHPTLGRQADFVALPLTQLDDVHLYPYELANTGPPIAFGPADTISVVGFPFGLQAGGSLAVWATGFVASEPVIDFNNLPIFLIDCRSRPGQSGSAVIAYRNGGMVALEDGSAAVFNGPVMRLLGIYSGRINEQSDIGIVWKAQAIQQLVNSIT
jgi:Trypsin-like peptidase domain